MDTNIYFIYSHYCKHCRKILSKLPSLQESINKICIDNEQFRKKILNNKLYNIEYVPCIIIFKDENVTIYQGIDATNYIHDKISIINTENNTLKKLQHNLDISYERLENEKKKTFNLQHTINELQNRLDNQVNELSSTHIERPLQSTQKPIQQSTQKPIQQSMRTSISDLMDDSDDETIETKPQTINDIAKRLQEGRQQS